MYLEFDLGISGDLPPTSDAIVNSRIDGETLESDSLSDDRISSSAAKTADVEAGNMDRLKGTTSLVITKKENLQEYRRERALLEHQRKRQEMN